MHLRLVLLFCGAVAGYMPFVVQGQPNPANRSNAIIIPIEYRQNVTSLWEVIISPGQVLQAGRDEHSGRWCSTNPVMVPRFVRQHVTTACFADSNADGRLDQIFFAEFTGGKSPGKTVNIPYLNSGDR